jgi:Glyoxalase-like domain
VNNGRMARLKDIVVDARHPASIARFWAVALDGVDVAPYDEAELERLRGIDVYDTEDDPTVVVEGAGMAHRLLFQRVPEAKVAKNRLHLDLTAVDVVAEGGHLKDLGARVVAECPDHTVLTDPEENEFCVGPR